MCVVCELSGIDYSFLNGPKKSNLTTGKLYQVFDKKVAHFPICYIHAIELFCFGEKKFLIAHKELVNDLNEHREKYTG